MRRPFTQDAASAIATDRLFGIGSGSTASYDVIIAAAISVA